MNKLVRHLLLLSIILLGTQIVSLPIGGVTLFQLSLILALLCSIFYLFTKKIKNKGKYIVFSIAFACSSVISAFISINPDWAKSYLLLGLMTAMLVFIIPNYFTVKDINLLEKTLIRSQYIVFPFSIYSFYMFYYRGGIPSHINLGAGMYIDLDRAALLRAQAAGQVRLMLPYATPPVLSLAMAICIIMLVTNPTLFSKRARTVLILAFSLVLLFTGSRTGIIALLLCFIVLAPARFKRSSFKIKTRYAIPIYVSIVLFGALFFYGINTLYFQKLVNRVAKFSLLTDRHILVPLDGLILWTSTIQRALLGIGFGSSANLQGAHTYLPPYFLNSYVTLIAERGILGIFLCMLLISIVVVLYKQCEQRPASYRSMTYALITGMLGCLFYEALNCYLLIFVIAICFMMESNSYPSCSRD